MHPVRSSLLCLLLVAVPATAQATRVYRSVAPDGTVLYSDQPGPGAQEIDVRQPAAIVPSPAPAAAPAQPQQQPPAAEERIVYTTLRITQPTDDAVHWFAEGPLRVEVEIVPPLAEGDLLVPIVDGIPQGSGVPASSFALSGLDPNTYQLVVAIHDADGQELKRSQSVRFHFKRQSLNLPARRAPASGGN
ncbi:DUF4124 domain-containing protein [Immundisolibacter sp.]|uniref:DUF4124 domain-containing protein n=1 Tax=Immundisolibacter sp. TaxID=1934948 RepID=UPI003569DD41